MAGTERTVLKGVQNPRSQFSSVNQVRLKNKKEGKRKNNGQIINSDDPQDGDPRADTKEHQSKVLQFGASDNTVKAAGYRTYTKNKQKVNNRFLTEYKHEPQMKGGMHLHDDHSALDPPAPSKSEAWSKVVGKRRRMSSDHQYLSLQDGHDQLVFQSGCEEFREPDNNARFPVLDEDMIAERGRSLPPDYGGGRRLTVKQSDKKDVGETRFASRGIAISTTPIQTDSNLMQSNIEATSKRVSNNDTPTSRHLSTDHPNQENKIGFTSMFVWKRKKTTNHVGSVCFERKPF